MSESTLSSAPSSNRVKTARDMLRLRIISYIDQCATEHIRHDIEEHILSQEEIDDFLDYVCVLREVINSIHSQ